MSVEFLLVLVLVVFPLLLGAVLLGRKVISTGLTWFSLLEEGTTPAILWDSSDITPPITGNKPIGRVIGYDQFEAPLILYRDTTAGVGFAPGVILGVRPNRFTSVAEVYYDQPDCPVNGNAYIRDSSSSWADQDFLAPLQQPTYAMGNGNILYRRSAAGFVGTLLSKWTSQNTEDASPAFDPSSVSSPLTTACTAIAAVSTTTVQGLYDLYYLDPANTALTNFGKDPLDPGGPDITVAVNQCAGSGFTTTAVATYGIALGGGAGPLPLPPTVSVGGTYTAIITMPGANATQLAAHTPYLGNKPVYVIDSSRFYYCISPTFGSTPTPSIQGQRQFMRYVLTGATAFADFYLADKVADLDASPNFTAPFRMAFHRSVP